MEDFPNTSRLRQLQFAQLSQLALEQLQVPPRLRPVVLFAITAPIPMDIVPPSTACVDLLIPDLSAKVCLQCHRLDLTFFKHCRKRV